jgi:hypothetical protein
MGGSDLLKKSTNMLSAFDAYRAESGVLVIESLVNQFGSIGKLIERSRRTKAGSIGATRSSTD